LCRKLKRDSIPKLPPALDETDILLIQKEEEVSGIPNYFAILASHKQNKKAIF
jgi:hypothetical protein